MARMAKGGHAHVFKRIQILGVTNGFKNVLFQAGFIGHGWEHASFGINGLWLAQLHITKGAVHTAPFGFSAIIGAVRYAAFARAARA